MLTLLTASARALVRALERMALPVDAVLASVGLSPEAIEDVETGHGVRPTGHGVRPGHLTLSSAARLCKSWHGRTKRAAGAPL
ncbi:MAG: hypothetical protein ACI9U2_002481, partial [Bradymonadia bacterium]